MCGTAGLFTGVPFCVDLSLVYPVMKQLQPSSCCTHLLHRTSLTTHTLKHRDSMNAENMNESVSLILLTFIEQILVICVFPIFLPIHQTVNKDGGCISSSSHYPLSLSLSHSLSLSLSLSDDISVHHMYSGVIRQTLSLRLFSVND